MTTKGERLRHFAKIESGKLNAFAEKIGVAASQLNTYVSNERFPKDDILEKIASLGCNIHWLVTGEGTKYADNEAGRALQAKVNDYNPERDDNVGAVLDGREVLESKVYKNVITETDVQQLAGLVEKLRSLV